MPTMLTYIAGAPYYEGARDAIAKLKEGDKLLLVREPNNKYDRNAVAVHGVDGLKLGHVPKVDAPAIAKVLDRELPYTCKRKGLSSTAIDISWEA